MRILTHWDAANTDAFLQKVAAYKDANPNVTIQVETVPFGDLLKRITASNLSGGGADIYHIYNAWLPELSGSKSIVPAPDAYKSDIVSAYGENIVSSVSYNGQIYGYPTELTGYALNYNKRLFEEAGISAPPGNWDELLDYAQRLTKKENGQTVQQGFGVIIGWDSGVVHPWLTLLQSNGGRFLSEDLSTTELDTPQALEALELYRKLVESGATNPEMGLSNASTTGPYMNNFELGKTAMIIMANWWKGSLQATMGDRFQDVATAPIPVGPSGSKPVSLFYSWLYAISAFSKQQEEAWKFLQWLNSPQGEGQSSIQGDWLMAQGIIPSRLSDQEAHKANLQDDPFMKTYVDLLKDARSFPVIPRAAEITSTLQGHIEQVLYSRATPADALKAASSDIQKLISQ
ncbi:MAG: hypothetical protein BAA02_14950 [Paenibacillaceae bacterium ZCTH02-B3]|nr:MAG: hypothetical protein BAA02_14950 [Paenibacillaceae bacterium ZCTH02-B3]